MEETEKGLYIKFIDRDLLRRQEEAKKKERKAIGDEERMKRALQKRVAFAQEQERKRQEEVKQKEEAEKNLGGDTAATSDAKPAETKDANNTETKDANSTETKDANSTETKDSTDTNSTEIKDATSTETPSEAKPANTDGTPSEKPESTKEEKDDGVIVQSDEDEDYHEYIEELEAAPPQWGQAIDFEVPDDNEEAAEDTDSSIDSSSDEEDANKADAAENPEQELLPGSSGTSVGAAQAPLLPSAPPKIQLQLKPKLPVKREAPDVLEPPPAKKQKVEEHTRCNLFNFFVTIAEKKY